MLILSLILLLILLLILPLVLYRKPKIMRFYRPDCKFCVKSQKEWDLFKAKSKYKIIDINTNIPENIRYMKRYRINYVPKIIKVGPLGIREFRGPNRLREYLKFSEY